MTQSPNCDVDSQVAAKPYPHVTCAEIDAAMRIVRGQRRADGQEGANGGEKLDKILKGLDDVMNKLDTAYKRLDAIEEDKRKTDAAKRTDAGASEGNEPETAVEDGDMSVDPVAADAVRRKDESAKADAQARADAVAAAFGERAPYPLSGEELLAYRRRLLCRFQPYSQQFKSVDLGTVKDAKTFDGIEATVYADALAASSSPIAADDTLLERSHRDQTGRMMTTFHGHPHVWMNQFSGTRRRLAGIRNSVH